MTPSEQSDSKKDWRCELVSVVALDEAESKRHREWLANRERRATVSHRKWIEAVMEKDRQVQRDILDELRAIRRALERP